jgi:hypothetical protein
MRVRHLVAERKIISKDTGWRFDDMSPRHCPIYEKTRPTRAGWQWRSARAEAGDREFVLVAQANVKRGDLKSVLILKTPSGYSVVGRYEFHSSHPGIHAHAHCDRGGLEEGATGLDKLIRIPPNGRTPRRTSALSISTFWDEARRFFRIMDDLGPLFS